MICSLDDPKCFKRSEIINIDCKGIQDLNTLRKIVFNGQNDLDTRIDALTEIANRFSSEDCMDLLQQILQLYTSSGASLFERFIVVICLNSSLICIAKKIDCMKTIFGRSGNSDVIIELCEYLYKELTQKGVYIFILDVLTHLLSMYEHSGVLSLEHLRLLYEYFDNENIDINTRYMGAISLSKQYILVPNAELKGAMYKQYNSIDTSLYPIQSNDAPQNRLFPLFITKGVFEYIISSKKIDTKYNILLCQYILQTYTTYNGEDSSEIFVDQELYEKTQQKLLDIAGNTDSLYNTRADAADVLLSIGSHKYKDSARDIILNMENDTPRGVQTTLYDSRQNVHRMDRHAHEGFQQMMEFHSELSRDTPSFTHIKKSIMGTCSGLPTIDNKTVLLALKRISNDNLLVDDRYKLIYILGVLWDIIQYSDQTESLTLRLIDELVDMSDTCTTGHLYRMVNVLSGFTLDDPKTGDKVYFSVKIDWEDQIYAYFVNSINREISRLYNMEEVLDEMRWDVKLGNKTNYNRFCREYIPILHEKLRGEFKGMVPSHDLELYLAICMKRFNL